MIKQTKTLIIIVSDNLVHKINIHSYKMKLRRNSKKISAPWAGSLDTTHLIVPLDMEEVQGPAEVINGIPL